MIIFILMITVFLLIKNISDFTPEDMFSLSEKIESFSLLDQEGKYHELSYYSDQKVIVIASYAIDCPESDQAVRMLEKIKRKYAKKDGQFLLIDANPADTREALQQKAKISNIDIPILMDETQLISDSLGFTHVGQVVVINPKNWELMYRAAIDNRYLPKAIKATLSGRKIKTPLIDVQNCIIPYVKDSAKISYEQDIVPILEKHCIACHNKNGSAPWTMTNYEKIKGWAPMISEVVKTKRMPPWGPDLYYDQYTNSNHLTIIETQKLIHWLEQGCPKEPHEEDTLPKIEEEEAKKKQGWPWGEPDIIVAAQSEEQIPPKKIYEYAKESAGKINNTKDLWARAIFFKPQSVKATRIASAWIDIQDPEQVLTNSSIQHFRTKTLLAYHSFNTFAYPQIFPKNTGEFIPKDSTVTFQTHYKTIGKAEKDRPQVGIYLYHGDPHTIKPIYTRVIEFNDISIPVNVKNYEITTSQILDQDIYLYACGFHMHYFGRSGKMIATYPDGDQKVLLSIPYYDYDWMTPYYFVTPKLLPKGTKLTLKYTYDTSVQNRKRPPVGEKVLYGTSGKTEMLGGAIIYTLADETIKLQ